jgi:hypothetical protein
MWGRTVVRGERTTRLSTLREHGGHGTRTSRRHEEALAALHAEGTGEAVPQPSSDRHDVPCFAACFTAYKGAKAGASFCSYTEDLDISRASGSQIPRSRGSREIARRLVECFAAELRIMVAYRR